MSRPSVSPVWAAILVLSGLATGCQPPAPAEQSANSPDDDTPQAITSVDGMSAVDILQKLVAAYRNTNTYMDNGQFGTHFAFREDGVQRQGMPVTLSLLLQKPNQYRITRIEPQLDGEQVAAVVVSDGKTLEGSISTLEPQRLQLPAPEVLALDATLVPDPTLRAALFPRPARDIFPQLELLLTPEGKTPWLLETPDELLLLEPKDLVRDDEPTVPCYRVRVATAAGPHTCWIDKSNFALLRIDIENDELAAQVYPGQDFLKFEWRFEFFNVAFDSNMPDEVFHLQPTVEEAKLEVVEAFPRPATETPATETAADEPASQPAAELKLESFEPTTDDPAIIGPATSEADPEASTESSEPAEGQGDLLLQPEGVEAATPNEGQ